MEATGLYDCCLYVFGEFITTSAEVTPKGSLVRESRPVLHNGAEQQDVRESYPKWP